METSDPYSVQLDSPFADPAWRVVRREVDSSEPITGRPLVWRAVAMPARYETAADTQRVADAFNAAADDEEGD